MIVGSCSPRLSARSIDLCCPSISERTSASRLGESSPTRGGRPKRFYTVETDGIEALRRAQAEWKAMAAGLTPLLEEKP